MLRASVARILVSLRYRVELASSEERARQLVAKERFDAAVVAPESLAFGELALLRELQDAASKLVLVTDDTGIGGRLIASFPDALVCASLPSELEKIGSFIDGATTLRASPEVTASGAGHLHFAGCTLDLPGCAFFNAKRQEVALTRLEFVLLVAFARNAGKVLSRAQLRHAIDGGAADTYDRSIDMLVARLRRKIEPDAAKPKFIITVAGAGYKFVSRVREEPAAMPSNIPRVRDHEDHSRRDDQRVERRQLTVLACQIVGFAALAAKLDPEDLERLISRTYAVCAEIIPRFGGTMARGIGYNIVAYFGYSIARENDAENAVYAALALVRALGAIAAAPVGSFQARVGVATSLMLVGAASYGGHNEPAAIGEALNLALHLQNSAPADSVVVGSQTRDLIGRLFDCREIEPITLEHGGAPAPVWRVFEENAGTSRFDALRRDEMLKIVGREAELDRLSRFWSDARRGCGRVAVVIGEPGIGKSRLVVEMQNRLRAEPHATLRYSGSPHRVEAPMSVLLDELQRSAGIERCDNAVARLEKLQRHFDATSDATQVTALIANLLNLPFEAPSDIRHLSPQKRKERTLAALLAQIVSIASKQPVLAIVEDAQWVDPSSLEFLALLVERARTLRLLLVIVGRPDFVPPWSEYSYVSTLTLTRLSPSDAAVLIHEVAGHRNITVETESEIISRADGVPLFVEELTKSVLERIADGRDYPSEPFRSYATRTAPSTLQGLLLSRFDRLGLGKEVAQAGAVIGREFSFELLRMIAGMDEATLASGLDQLVATGLAFRRGSPSHAKFVFKHALVREAAYDMLPRQQRQKLHANVVRSYEESFQEIAKGQPELLAYHCREAGKSLEAIAYFLAAAERALERSATTESLSHLAQARELISGATQSRNRLQLEVTLELTSARALLAARGYTAPETREAYRRAREHCEALGDQDLLPLIIHGQWLGAWTAADHQSALEHARQLYLWGQRNHDQIGLAVGHTDLGMTLTTQGQLVEARRHLDQALQINRFVLPGRQPFVASDVDGRISALSFLHDCLLLLGFPDKAKAAAEEAASLNPQNRYSRALAQMRLLRMHVFVRDASTVAEIGPDILSFVQEQGYPYFVGTTMIYVGWALACCGDAALGTATCKDGLGQLQSVGGRCWLPLFLTLLAECHEQSGRRDDSAAALTQALDTVEASGERIWEAEIHRLKGKLLLSSGNVEAASSCFTTALHKAKARQSRLLELRAAASLADLLLREHKSVQARLLLTTVYGSFSEGFEFVDLREAKALLDVLSV
jgi:class 3 adenylate cyclase/DNA-binding response OmpR family regulator/tetratricopeptide (TPR) repeat protein